jgi:ATP-dependent helicase/nuclease subunit A
MDCPQTAPTPEVEAAAAKRALAPTPAWLAQPAPHERWPRTLKPSRQEGIDHRTVGATASTRTRGQALLRGRLVHRLLEILPAVPAERRRAAGTRFLTAEAAALPKRQREELLDAVFAIFEARDFGEVFGPGSQAEVALSAILPPRSAGQPPIVISGQVDRLICAASEILIVDYKSGSALPQSPETVQKTYIAQLAAYRLALANMFPGKSIRAALLWTEMPMLMEIPAALLDASESLLYESVRESHLDLPPPRT